MGTHHTMELHMKTHARRSYKVWAMVGTLLVGVGAAAMAPAQQPAGTPGPLAKKESLLTPEDRTAMRQIFWHRVQERLGLSDQQVADIQKLFQTQRTATQSDVQNLIAARKQLRTLLEQSPVDSTAVQNVATQVKTLQAKLFDDRLQTQLALRGKFTGEQWQGWLALRKGMGHGWNGRGHAFGPGA
jgi:Spy/CpxP family protein refolding chaperone